MRLSDLTPVALLHDPERAFEIWCQIGQFRREKPNFFALLRELGDLLTCKEGDLVHDMYRERRLHQHVRPVYRALQRDWEDDMCNSTAGYKGLDHPRLLCEIIGIYFYGVEIRRQEPKDVLWDIIRSFEEKDDGLTIDDIKAGVPKGIWEHAVRSL